MSNDLTLPPDYRDWLDRHGPGTFAGVLRLLAPNGPDGFDLATERARQPRLVVQPVPDPGGPPPPDGLLWGVFDSGETCWWLPIRPDPWDWLVAVSGDGGQQLNISTTEFLRRWAAGELDLPVLPFPPAVREPVLTPPGKPIPDLPVTPLPRDPLAQLATLIGPPTPQAYDWPAVEAQTGTRLPTEYKRLCEAYGPRVSICGARVSAPAELRSWHDLLSYLHEPRFPAPGGQLLCLSSESKTHLCWDTTDPDPDNWPLVDSDQGTVLPGTLTEILVAELIGTSTELFDFELGDPDDWTSPYWGPDRH